MKDARSFYIDGGWVSPLAGTDHPEIDPSTEEHFATVSLGGQADTDRAVAAARRAFPAFCATDKAERLALLRRVTAIYSKRAGDIALAMSREMGAPSDFANGIQVQIGTYDLEEYIDALEAFEFEHALGPHAPRDRIIREPIGVSAMITPWNWPMNQITLKVGAALAAGCTMVLKPSEASPISAMIFAEVLHEARVPPGVFNLVNGDGPGVGTQLSLHPDLDFISFTGSSRAGAAITRAAADTVKRVSLELGGKGANIVFADADSEAVRRGVSHCFENTGQSCNAPTRMLVERSRYAQVVVEAALIAEKQSIDVAQNPGPHIGPVINRVQFERIQEMIRIGIDEGARLIAGGLGRPNEMSRGYFVRPTVFADCTNDMAIMRQEIFGPVLCMMPFDTEDEAIHIANDTPYGLTNYVQT